MFNIEEKKEIAAIIETVLLSFNHPEMPTEKPKFKLHVDGKEAWSWADIEPNWYLTERRKIKVFLEWWEAHKFDEMAPGGTMENNLPIFCEIMKKWKEILK